MSEYVAVDTASPPGGDLFFTVGVVVEISDKDKFRSYYFEKIRNFLRTHQIEIPFPVIKARTIVDNLPSYEIRDGNQRLVQDLISNPGISRINISIGWYGADVQLGFKDSANLNGNTFASDYLEQYFNIVALWRYHKSHTQNLAPEALIDNVQGHITKAWKYCGNEFDLNFIPNGDLTYPSLSTADIIAYNLGTYLAGHEEDKLTNFPDIASEYIIQRRNWDVQPYIHAEAVNERYTDHIVPTLPYTIQDSIHYPHPVLFIHDEILSGEDKSVLPRTDFHAIARKWAYENDGCVVNLKPSRLPGILRSDDVIVYTKGSDSSVPRLLQDLHPTKELEIMDSDELIDELTS
ncbi:hypothetical protein [Natronomonas sp. EA1]|uniref:hypothetical protein n=1 Tax=Natronomonas sp. EA1 TaxID=3421655 RepID=UPI003EBC03E0